MWFVGWCTTGASSNGFVLQEQEWWDNNFGAKYRIGFTKRVVKDRLKEEERNGIYNGVNVNRRVPYNASREYLIHLCLYVDITNKNHLFSQISPL